ncbi:MAG: AmmeMemoRadiSam system protein B [Pseudomonadota bacterium]
MSAVRMPAVAGTFYPGDPETLARSVDDLLANATDSGEIPRAIIAPHAGYIYSGPIAAAAYAPLKQARGKISRVVLLGPSHRVAFRGIAACRATSYRTPLGDIPVDQAAVKLIYGLAGVGYLDRAHEGEHALEVQLPFLQRTLGDFSLVPLVVGEASAEDVAGVLDRLWDLPGTLVVISSDLSHYHTYDEARRLDAETAEKISQLDATLVGEQACGYRPVNGLLTLVARRHLRIEQIDVRNSGDTAGDRNQVVGYGAWRVRDTAAALPRDAGLPLAQRQRLLQVAREAILRPLTSAGSYSVNPAEYPALLQQQGAAFVTLTLNDNLRGCIGSLEAHRPLVLDVASNAQSAAFRDPRFAPLTLAEYQDLEVHISVLSQPQPLDVDSRDSLVRALRPGIDGLIIEEDGHRATYLPSVWAQLPDPGTFVAELRRKAGLGPDGWSAATRVFTYQTEEFC